MTEESLGVAFLKTFLLIVGFIQSAGDGFIDFFHNSAV